MEAQTNPRFIFSAHLFSLFIYEGGGSLVVRCDSENVHWLSAKLEVNFTLERMQRAGFVCPSWCLTPLIQTPINWEKAFESQRSSAERLKLKYDRSEK